jgi:hypothetical protein
MEVAVILKICLPRQQRAPPAFLAGAGEAAPILPRPAGRY